VLLGAFDELKITHTESPVLQVNAYYPFGMMAYTWLRDGEKENLYGYQNKEYDSLTRWHDFHARQYDGVLGRMWSNDPKNQFASGYVGMGNNPVMMIDPDGEFAWFVPLIFAGVNLAADAIGGDINSWGDAGRSLLKGGIQGTFAALAGPAAYAAKGAGWVAFSQAVSSQLPGVTIPFGDSGGGITLSPSFIFGSHRFSVGLNAATTIQVGEFGLTYGYGFNYGTDLGPSGRRVTQNLGVAATYNSRDFGFSFGVNNYYSGETSQQTGVTRIRFSEVNIGFENDYPFGDLGDRYRTGALEISYRDFAIGLNVYTGDPRPPGTTKEDQIDFDYAGGKYGVYKLSSADQYRNGLLYASYRGSRIGIDSEGVRAFAQNSIHNWMKVPHFRRLSIPNRFYYEYFKGYRFGLF
jgi:RHS repeat-associated protein